MRKDTKASVILLAAIGSFIASPVAGSQGFGPGVKAFVGAKTETAAIVRKLPPVVDLAGTSVKITFSKLNSVPNENVEIAQRIGNSGNQIRRRAAEDKIASVGAQGFEVDLGGTIAGRAGGDSFAGQDWIAERGIGSILERFKSRADGRPGVEPSTPKSHKRGDRHELSFVSRIFH